jgi:hypothetical protein
LESKLLMTLRALVLTATLATVGTGGAALAQEPASGTPSKKDDAGLNLPVSLDKIRAGLAQPAPAEPLKGLNDPPPTFKVEIQEQQKFDELVSKLKFDKGGPPVPGGIDAYEQYQRIFPRIDNPLAQPYAGFTTGEMMTLGIEALIEKYLAQKMAHVVGNALRAQAEREAREEVARSLAQFWASQSSPSTASSSAAPPKE